MSLALEVFSPLPEPPARYRVQVAEELHQGGSIGQNHQEDGQSEPEPYPVQKTHGWGVSAIRENLGEGHLLGAHFCPSFPLEQEGEEGVEEEDDGQE